MLVHGVADHYAVLNASRSGFRWKAPEAAPLNPLAGRLLRAQANLYETLPLFIGALLGAAAIAHLGWKTEAGASLYFVGRLIYLPLYAFGVPKVRTLAWLIAMAGLLLTLWALIFG